MLRDTPRFVRSFTALCAVTALTWGCASTSVVNEAEPAADASTAPPPASAEGAPAGAETAGDPGPKTPEKGAAAADPKGAEAAKSSKADGDACDKSDECASGACEGEGCGAGQGKCAAKDRQCTMDLRAYCGCDGKTFQASGSCPRARYSKKGPCAGDPLPSIPGPKPPK